MSLSRIAIVFLISTAFHVSDCLAQSSRDSESPQASSRSSQIFSSEKKASKKAYQKKENQALVEYEELMKSNKKKYRKMAKGMKKPQYSDPTYFGHKRKPKKRKLGKRKFCEECGIIH